MPWRELPGPIPMRRIAVVAPTRRWRNVLVAVADSGVVEPEEARTLRDRWTGLDAELSAAGGPRLAADTPDLEAWRAAGR